MHDDVHHKQKQALTFAFWLNLCFSAIEIAGSFYTNSTAILTDAIHDLGDSLAIGLGIVFEKIAGRKPDSKYTYGYKRFSLLSALILSILLLVGAVVMIWKAVDAFLQPHPVNSEGMFSLAVLGIVINGAAFLKIKYSGAGQTKQNSKAIMLHFLEDVLGWIAVLVGSVVIYFTQWYWIDGILSIVIALYIGWNAFTNLKETMPVFLQAAPQNIAIDTLRETVLGLEGVKSIEDLHVWALDEDENIGSVRIVAKKREHIENILSEVNTVFKKYSIHKPVVQIEVEKE